MTWIGPDPRPINEGPWKKGTQEYRAYRLLYKAWSLRQARISRNARGQGCKTSRKKLAARALAQAGTVHVLAHAAAWHPPQSRAHTVVVGIPMYTPVTSRQDTPVTSRQDTSITSRPGLLTVTATTNPARVAPPPVPPAALNADRHFQPHPTRKHPLQLRTELEARIRAEVEAKIRAEVVAERTTTVSPTPSYSPPPNSSEDSSPPLNNSEDQTPALALSPPRRTKRIIPYEGLQETGIAGVRILPRAVREGSSKQLAKKIRAQDAKMRKGK